MKALLLIHGFLTGTDDWDLVVPELKDRYDEIVLFKQPGHERADEKTHYKDFTAENCYAEMDKTLADLEERFDEVDIVGHSMGGGMSLYAASKLRNVGKAILLAPALRFPRPGAFMRHNAAVSRLDGMAKSCSDEALADALSKMSENVKQTYKESLDVFFKRLLPNWSPHNLLTFVRIMGKAEKCVEEVTCPLYVIWGELDEFVPRKSAEFILEKTQSRNKTFITYETVGHAMMYIGNVRVLLRDVCCILDGGDPCELPADIGELRTATRITESDGGVVDIFTVTDKIVLEKSGVREIRENSQRSERRSPAPAPVKKAAVSVRADVTREKSNK